MDEVLQDKEVVYEGIFHGKKRAAYKNNLTGDWIDAEDSSVIYPFEEFRSPVKKESK